MLKIGDFSKFSRVPVKTLRFYDEIGLLKPMAVDQYTGYRYYSTEQLTRLNRIVGLKELGLSLDEIGQLLADNLPTIQIIELLQKKQQETLKRLREEKIRLKKVEEWLLKVEKEGTMPASEVLIKKVEIQLIASVRGVIPNYADCSRLFKDLYSYLGKKRAKFSEPSMIIYHDHEYREKDADVEVAVPLSKEIEGSDKVKVYQLPAVDQMACIIHKGPYDNLGQTYSALMKWVEINHYEISGPNRELYLKGPGMILKGNPADYVTEIQLPIGK